jgi:hypothetical protein
MRALALMQKCLSITIDSRRLCIKADVGEVAKLMGQMQAGYAALNSDDDYDDRTDQRTLRARVFHF